jgi:uncharacterized protein (TIGR03435 family)
MQVVINADLATNTLLDVSVATTRFLVTDQNRTANRRSTVLSWRRLAAGPAVPAPAVSVVHRSNLEGCLMKILAPRTHRPSPRSIRLAVAAFALCAFAAVSLHLQAQAPPPPPTSPAQASSPATATFEVASIKRNKDEEGRRAEILQTNPNAAIPPGRAQTLRGGGFLGRGMTVRELIRDAYGYRNRSAADVVDGPGWIDSERYDVQAKAGFEFPGSTALGLPPSAEAALRALLAERMNLRVRTESRTKRVYEMVMARGDRNPGPNLTPAKGDCRSFYTREAITPLSAPTPTPTAGDEPKPVRPCVMAVSLAGVFAENLTMEEWARFLAAFPQVNTTVIDRTGMTGAFDFKLNGEPNEPGAATGLLPALQPVLESQLGLRLRPAQAPVEVLVIDRVERPTEN